VHERDSDSYSHVSSIVRSKPSKRCDARKGWQWQKSTTDNSRLSLYVSAFDQLQLWRFAPLTSAVIMMAASGAYPHFPRRKINGVNDFAPAKARHVRNKSNVSTVADRKARLCRSGDNIAKTPRTDTGIILKRVWAGAL